MSTNTITTEMIHEMEAFLPPPVKQGMPVRWYPYCDTNDRQPEIAFVVRGNRRCITVRTASGQLRETVRHISDPKLKLNEAQRENGAWDYTEDHLFQQAAMEDFSKRIAAIEKTVAALTASAAKGR